MKINKSKNKKIFLISIIIFLIGVGIYFSYSINRYRLNFENSSEDAVNILLNDNKIQSISHYGVWLSESASFCPFDIAEAKGVCKEKMLEYENIRKKIQKDVVFYRCEGDIMIRRVGKGLYHVSVKSGGDLVNSGVQMSSGYNGWIGYYNGTDGYGSDPCYPWNDLENYWKIYGKASPEEIQAVIDEENIIR